MSLPSLSLRRPVLAFVLNIFIVLFGIIGFQSLGVRDYPSIDPPIINVRTTYAGASPDIIESQITEPLEKSINGIAGIRTISSTSAQGQSSITVEFDLGVDLEAAANDVRDKVSRAIRNLPEDLDAPPVVSKSDANTQTIISMTVQSDQRNQLELTEYAENVLLEKLQTIPGVSEIRIWGEKRFAMRLWLDPVRMAGYGVSFPEVEAALAAQNVELPSGKLAGDYTELSVRTFGRLFTEEDFNELIVKHVEGTDIKLKDIGEAVLGPENEETILKDKNIPMIALAISPQPGSNYVAIADEFYRRFEEIKKDLPPDFRLDIAMDTTTFIKQSILEVEETILISLCLVILIIYLFFRDWLIALRPLIDIPVCLIGAFFIMYVMDFSINILTLLGMVLATGLVVDDGIVVTENIYKRIEKGMEKHRAAREGSEEIYFAVISTSVTLAVVFLPVVFMEGFTGRLFREFGVVVAGAVLISAFVSLSLTPVLNVIMTRKNHKPSAFYRKTEPFFVGMESGYRRTLGWLMNRKWVAVVAMVICIGLIFLIGAQLQSELAPLEDRSRFRILTSAPEGTSYDAMDEYMTGVVDMLIDSVPESSVILSVTAPGFMGAGAVNSGFVNVKLHEPGERTRTQSEIVGMVNRNLREFNFGRGFAIEEQTISVQRGGSAYPIVYVIQHVNFAALAEALPRFMDEVYRSPVFQGADVDLKFNKPELSVTVDRAKASAAGVSVADISRSLQMAFSNLRLGYFTRNGKQYQVLGQVERDFREDPGDLRNIHVRSQTGELISIDNFIELEETTSPSQIYHYNRYKSATISAGLTDGHTIGDGIEEMNRIFESLREAEVMDEGFSTALAGASKDYQDSSSNTLFAFLLALVLIYLILAAQFESFVDPLIIMLTVPLAMTGAVISLILFDQTLNIFSQIGMIMLIGLVTKNGILIVEYANQIRDRGKERLEAVIEASTLRLRPILMTSFTMIFGALPLALSLGAASSSRMPLGIVIVGGVLFSLILSLLILPVMYTFLSRRKPPVATTIDKLDE